MSWRGLVARFHLQRRIRELAAPIFAGLVLFSLSASAMPAPGDAGPTDPAVTSNTGAAQFRIPIAVPPGPGGFAPNVDLAYSSRSGDGPFGVGWSLGFPEIYCSVRFGVPDFASCEKFELAGTLLVKDPNPEAPNEYHTFVESFQRIRYVPSTTGDYWTVEQRNGTKLYFGQLASHRISQGGNTARWLLERMEDAFGNPIFFEYDTTTDVGSAYPVAILYGAGATRSAGPREVRFIYEARPDARHIFTGGIEQKITRRLREIQVFGHGEIFRRHVFGYDLTGVNYTTDRSRLSWVQEFGTDCADPGLDPVGSCTGLPRREFRYRDAYDVSSSGAGSQLFSLDDYRIPFGSYQDLVIFYEWKKSFPQLIGDLNGDGMPDRVQLEFTNKLEPATQVRVLINRWMGGFSATDPSVSALAATYQQSIESLTYVQPGWDYVQIPAPITGRDWFVEEWNTNGTMHAMCSVTPTSRVATLSQELHHDGVEAATTGLWAGLVASEGAPFAGSIEPRPSVKLVDLDSDGLADLVLSIRLSGVKRHFDCDGTELATPQVFPPSTVTVVFRNTGSGWINDAEAQALAEGLPPFEEVIVRSSYQTELEDPAPFSMWDGGPWGASPCANMSYLGFEQKDSQFTWPSLGATTVCHVPIDLSPQFVDFNGDGLPDLAVLQRDYPDRLWTGEAPLFAGGRNNARTRVWIQDPTASPRWIRAPQYDLPLHIWPTTAADQPGFAHVGLVHVADPQYYPVPYCYSWTSEFYNCGPPTLKLDNRGVRFADMNGDGLTDVVWKGQYLLQEGVLLNTGSGSNPFSAWCASNSWDAVHVGSACPEAAAYLPPGPLAISENYLSSEYSALGSPAGMLADLNGDGALDYVRLQLNYFTTESWIQSPAGATGASVWRRDDRFDFPINWSRSVVHPQTGYTVQPGLEFDDFIPAFRVFDVNGDGSADLVADQHAFVSMSRYSDLLSSVDNGHDGLINIDYGQPIRRRLSSLEVAADLDAQQPETPEGGDASFWRAGPVVRSVEVTGPDFAPALTSYRYAHPRFCTGLRSDLGFRLVERSRPDFSKVEEYFYQDHGRAGQLSRRLVKYAGAVVHRYQASWDQVAGPVPGSISDVFHSRLTGEESGNEYAGGSGASVSRSLSYDDGHGYDFVSSIRTERPTGVLVDTRIPDSDFGAYVIGRNAGRTLRDELTGVTLQDTMFTYLDPDGNPTGPKLGSRSDRIVDRGAPPAAWVDVAKYRYDVYGNLIEEQTPNPAGAGNRITLHCYDGDTGCPGAAGQSSHSVRVATLDPAGKQTRMTPDRRSGIIVGLDSDYTDQPATRTALDPFARSQFEYVTPTGGTEVLVAENVYDDANGPLRVERFEYVEDDPASDSIYSAAINGAFGGVWKAIAKTPSGYVGTMTFRDSAMRRVRTTLPIDCGSDPTCALFSGETQAAVREVESDTVGRPIRIDTPDGFAIMAYFPVADRPYPAGLGGLGSFDGVLVKNGKGDLLQRVVDGDRSVWVDECHTGVAAGLDSLDSVACGAADTTLYTYEATGEVLSVYDARAVEQSSFNDANQRLRYAYDTLGRVVRIEDPDLEGTGFSTMAFNDAGLVASTTNARGELRIFAYNVLGRLEGVTTPIGQDDYSVTYRPTEFQREKDSSEAYERLRTYDGWGRVKQTKLSVVKIAGNFSGKYLTDFEYDVAGRLAEVVHPDSTRVRYEYEGAYLKRVCDLGTASDCSDPSVVQYVSDVTYDTLGRRKVTMTAAGNRTFTYDGDQPRLLRDRFGEPSDPYWFELNYTDYDELGNVIAKTGSSLPGDIDLNESFEYDTRNRLDAWTKEGTVYDYDYDELGNLTLHGDNTQVYDDAARPHAIKKRMNGNADYAYDPDGNLTSIVSAGSAQYFTFDSANRLVCIDDSVANGCGVSRIHYDVDGRRVLGVDGSSSGWYVAYVDDSVRIDKLTGSDTRIEISAFGERIAYKMSNAPIRTAALIPFSLPSMPPAVLHVIALLGLAGLVAWAQRRGALVLVLDRPYAAGVSSVLIVALILYPVPFARAGGGGGDTTIYWELADRLGTGMVMLDETGARVVHRTYSPFGVEHASAGAGSWMPGHYAGHLEDEDSGLVYMQARWMDPESGAFLSVDPLVSDAGDPQSYNAYAYARNNPISNVDPTGGSQVDCFGNCGGTMYFSGPNGSFTVNYTGAQAKSINNFAKNFYGLGGNVSFNGVSVSFSLASLDGVIGNGESASDESQSADGGSTAGSDNPTIGGDSIAGGLMDLIVADIGRRQALDKISEMESELGESLSTEAKLAVIGEFETQITQANEALARQVAAFQTEIDDINSRGFFGKIAGIPRLWQISWPMADAQRGLEANRLRLMGVAIARQQVLGNVRGGS